MVKMVNKLILMKTLVHGGKKISKQLEVSAAAKREGGYNPPLILFVASNTALDMYEYVTASGSALRSIRS